MTSARTRIGRVKLKGGADLKVFPGLENTDRRYVEKDVRGVLDSHMRSADARIAGFAFVVWDVDGTSTCIASVNDGSTIPAILVPDFVRNRLLPDRIERWTIDTVNEAWA